MMPDEMKELRIEIKRNIVRLMENQEYDKAERLLNQYLNLAKDDPEAFSMQSVLFAQQDMIDKAMESIESGLKIDKSNFDLLYNQAYLYEQKEDYQRAREIYKLIINQVYEEEQRELASASLSKLEKMGLLEKYNNKRKLVFFIKPGLDGFIDEIIQSLSQEYMTKKVIVTQFEQIDEEMKQADICWFEWCDELVAYGSKLNFAKEKFIICRLHSYEAFVDYANQVLWDNINNVIFVAEHIRSFVLENTPTLSKETTVVIPNGIDVNKYQFKERSRGFNIAYVGYINYKKGPMLLLHAFKAIHDRDPRYKLYIAGTFQDARYVLYFRQMIQEFKLENSVIYQGWQDNVDQWLEDKNYIISTSVLEGHPVSIMQAMAKGIKPLIHNFVGARGIYPDSYVWSTIDQCVKLLRNKEYDSTEYRDFIANKYSIVKQLEAIRGVLEDFSYRKNEKEGIEVEQPLVTIGITNYDAQQFLDECLTSVINQTYKNVEIIVIDDFSKDESIVKLQKYEKNYKNIKLIIHDQNSGSPDLGRQEIIQMAYGKYFMFVDSDDFFANTNAIANLVNIAEQDTAIDYVYCNLQVVDEHDNAKEVWQGAQYQPEQVVYQTFNRGGSGILNMKGLFKTEFFRKNNIAYLSNGTAGDTLTLLACIKQGMRLHHVNQNLIAYRQHGNNFTFNVEKRILAVINILEYIIKNYDKKIYFPEENWDSLSKEENRKKMNLLIIQFYYILFKHYHEGNWMPWNTRERISQKQMLEYLIPIKDKIIDYMTAIGDLKDVDKLNTILTDLNTLYNEKIVLVDNREKAFENTNEDSIIFFYDEEYQKAKDILSNSKIKFEQLVKEVENISCEEDMERTAYAVMKTADFAYRNHPGVYFSKRLEEILLRCAKKLSSKVTVVANNLPQRDSNSKKRNVLHVLSQGYETGGHTRLIYQWCRKDNSSTHSVVSLLSENSPDWLIAVARENGGWYCTLEQADLGLCARAKILRDMAYSWADLVVLHTHPFDPIATISFGVDGGPPVLLLNHADHTFWLGVSVADMVVNLRPSGSRTTLQKRGTKRATSLPIPMSLPVIRDTKESAREKLGISNNSVVLLSVASPYKYTSSGECNFKEILCEIINTYPNTIALIVGPENTGEWKEVSECTKNRIRVLGSQRELELYHNAADIYLDSFCLGSITAMLEAGVKGIPAVYLESANKLLVNDDASVQKVLEPSKDIKEYKKNVHVLIGQEVVRHTLGQKLAEQIKKDHIYRWLDLLRKMYEQAPVNHSVLTHYEAIAQWDNGDLLWALLQNKVKN